MKFFGRIFWGGIFWEKFWGGIFWEDDLFVKILVFVKILSQGKKEGRKISILRSGIASSSRLKTKFRPDGKWTKRITVHWQPKLARFVFSFFKRKRRK